MSGPVGSVDGLQFSPKQVKPPTSTDEEGLVEAEMSEEGGSHDIRKYYPVKLMYGNQLAILLLALFYLLAKEVNGLLFPVVLLLMAGNYYLVQYLLQGLDTTALGRWHEVPAGLRGAPPRLWYTGLPLVFLFINLQLFLLVTDPSQGGMKPELEVMLVTVAMLLTYDLSLLLYWIHEDQLKYELVGEKVNEYVFAPLTYSFHIALWGLLLNVMTESSGLPFFLIYLIAPFLILWIVLAPLLSLIQASQGLGGARTGGLLVLLFILFVVIYFLTG